MISRNPLGCDWRANCRGQTAHEWLTDGVASADLVVDLGCVDGPFAALNSGQWVGVDRSMVELGAARITKTGALVQGDFEHFPIRHQSVGTVLCSMSDMLAGDLDAALSEIRRVLRPGGPLRLLLPATKPLTARDLLCGYASLQRALSLDSYVPSTPLLNAPATRLRELGFGIVSDQCSRFTFDVANEHHALLLIRSLYPPGVDKVHRERAVSCAKKWRGSALGISLRRVVVTFFLAS